MTNGISRPLLAVLGLLAMTSPLITDMYLAAFTNIAADLGASASQVQLTLTGFLLGLGLGQLVFGTLSDALGRRVTLLWGLSLFVLVSVAMVFSPTIEVFVLLRFIQGISGSVGIVLARAIVADLTSGADTVRALSIISVLIGIAPIIAPLIGGAAMVFVDWRGVLAVVALFTITMLTMSALFIPETLAPADRTQPRLCHVASNMAQLLTHPRFVFVMLAFGTSYGALAAFIAASPFIGPTLFHMSPLEFSIAFAVSTAALIVANLINVRIARRVRSETMLLIGASVALISTLTMFIVTIAGQLLMPVFFGLAFVLVGSTGLILTNGSALGLAASGRARGTGAALLGASQFLVGALVAPIVGIAGQANALPMAIVMVLSTLVVFAGAVGVQALKQVDG